MNELLTHVPAMEREADELERRAEALRQIIAGVMTLNGDLSLFDAPKPATNGNGAIQEDGPRGREAVRLIMGSRSGSWTIKQLKTENHKRKWPSSPKSLESAVHRLVSDGDVARVRKGVYRLVATEGVN